MVVPNDPIVPFVIGDGTGPDIWNAASRVLDGAVEKAYGGEKKIEWLEVLAGEKAFNETGEWLPQSTIDAFRDYKVGIKGPLSTPVGEGIRSLNVTLRQELDLYVCLRPVRHFTGVPSPVARPDLVDMVIFRENTEDIYAGIEFSHTSDESKELLGWMKEKGVSDKIRFPDTAAYAIKPISVEGSARLAREGIKYTIENGRKSVTIIHKGNIMKLTEGLFRNVAYDVATSEFREDVVTERESWILGNVDSNPSITVEENAMSIEPGYVLMTDDQKAKLRAEVEGVLSDIGETHGNGQWKNKVVIRDAIADIALQQVLTRPTEFETLLCMNLEGDFLSDALAAQVGGIGIAPGANIGVGGTMLAEATHGTAPKYAGQDKVNPGSVILSGEMLLRHMGWSEAADLILHALDKTIGSKNVTYDFERLMDGATLLKCSEFADHIIDNME